MASAQPCQYVPNPSQEWKLMHGRQGQEDVSLCLDRRGVQAIVMQMGCKMPDPRQIIPTTLLNSIACVVVMVCMNLSYYPTKYVDN